MSVSQIKLISAICKNLDKQGVKSMNPRQYNAVTQAANSIIAALDQEHQPAVAGMGLDAWLKSDDTGLSSEYMASILGGGFSRKFAYPLDPDDFGRCMRLLVAVPEFAEKLDMMRRCGPIWDNLVDKWQVISKAIEEEKFETAYVEIRTCIEKWQAVTQD